MADEIIIKVPDIGGATHVDVIEILVGPGDKITKDMSLITLESDKASMEIPAPFGGRVLEIMLKIGDKISQGDEILRLAVDNSATAALKQPELVAVTEKTIKEVVVTPPNSKAESLVTQQTGQSLVSAGPAVRRMAREFGVDLTKVLGSGRKNRISKENLQQYVKQCLSEKRFLPGVALPEMPVIDFSKFGPINSKPLNKIKRLTAVNLHRAWITVPHVTQFDDADITELEEFRKL